MSSRRVSTLVFLYSATRVNIISRTSRPATAEAWRTGAHTAHRAAFTGVPRAPQQKWPARVLPRGIRLCRNGVYSMCQQHRPSCGCLRALMHGKSPCAALQSAAALVLRARKLRFASSFASSAGNKATPLLVRCVRPGSMDLNKSSLKL